MTSKMISAGADRGRGWIFLVMLLSFAVKAADEGTVLHLYTEEYAPLSYTENGKLTGIATKAVRAIIEETGLDTSKVNYNVLPWARALQDSQREPLSCIFAISRLPSREEKFHWIGELLLSHEVLIARKNKYPVPLSSKVMAKSVVGVVRKDISAELVKARNLSFRHVYSVTSHSQLLLMLLSNRVDFWAVEDIRALAEFDQTQTPLADFEPVYVLGNSHNYLACNLNMPTELRHSLEQAYSRVADSGLLNSMLQEYQRNLPDGWLTELK